MSENSREESEVFDDLEAELEAAISRFEKAWRSGQRLSIDDCIDDCLAGEGNERQTLLVELVHTELELRLQAGEPARVEQYLERYPELEENRETVVELIVTEYTARRQLDPATRVAEYEERFPQHRDLLAGRLTDQSAPRRRFPFRLTCPHCHSPIAAVEGSTEGEFVCPICGSSVSIEQDRTLSWEPQKLPPLGKFQLLQVVGRGAFGTVYRARDTELDRIVAVKVPRSGTFSTKEDEDRFVREARNVARLHHSGIVPVYEVGHTDEFPYIVTQYVEGITLADALTGRRFSFKESAEIILQLARALAHSHEHGVVHRDLKPSNVMLEGFGSLRVLLMDFGLARRDEGEVTMTMAGQVLGTPAYMSPEQAGGESHRVDGRSDVYSLGVMLYELLAGELPFRGNTRMLLHQVLHEEPRPPRSLNDRIPRDLETITLKCLQKQPGRRYQECGELADDLERFLGGRPIQARPVSRAERAVRWARRHPARFALLAVSMVALIALLALGGALWYNAELRAASVRSLADARQQLLESRQQLEKVIRRKDDETQRIEALRQQSERIQQAIQEQRDRSLYATQLQKVSAVWREDPELGQQLLNDEAFCPPRRRDFTWGYWHRLCQRELLSIRAKNFVALSPNDSLFAGRDEDGIGLFSARDGRLVKRLTIPQDVLKTTRSSLLREPPSFSPDGLSLAVPLSKAVAVLDVATGQPRAVLACESTATWVAFSPDGAHLLAGHGDWGQKNGAFSLWQTDGWKLLRRQSTDTMCLARVAWAPDNARFATLSTQTELALWAVGQDAPIQRAQPDPSLGTWVAFSPDGQQLAVTTSTGLIYFYDLPDFTMSSVEAHEAGLFSVAYDSGGTMLATASGNWLVSLWDRASRQKLFSLKGHDSRLDQVGFFRDGERLFSVQIGKEVKVWSWNRQPWTAHRLDAPVEQAAFIGARNAWLTASTAGPLVVLRDGDSFQPVKRFEGAQGKITALATDPGARIVAAGTEQGWIYLWDFESGDLLQAIEAHVAGAPAGLPYTSVVSLMLIDETRLVSGSRELHPGGNSRGGEAKVWDTQNGIPLAVLGQHPAGVQSLAVAPDGQYLLTGDALGAGTGNVRIWDAATFALKATIDTEAASVTRVRFSHDGKILGTAGNRLVKLWSWNDGQPVLQTVLKGHIGTVHDFAFARDDGLVASVDHLGTIKLWDATSGQERSTLPEAARAGEAKPITNQRIRVAFDGHQRRLLRFDGTATCYGWQRD